MMITTEKLKSLGFKMENGSGIKILENDIQIYIRSFPTNPENKWGIYAEWDGKLLIKGKHVSAKYNEDLGEEFRKIADVEDLISVLSKEKPLDSINMDGG